MNYLAHLYFADDAPLHRLGNLAGDWVKGRIENLDLPSDMIDGIRRHRWVDSRTDQHPALRHCHRLFHPARRRAVPIILDMAFDHLLIRHWPDFASRTLTGFLDDCYADLARTREYWPRAAQPTLDSMVRRRWLLRYRDPAHVAAALDRIADRLSRDIGLRGTETELRAALPALRPLHHAVMRDLRDALPARNPSHLG